MFHQRTSSLDSFKFNHGQLNHNHNHNKFIPQQPIINESNLEEISIKSKRTYNPLNIKSFHQQQQQYQASYPPKYKRYSVTNNNFNNSPQVLFQVPGSPPSSNQQQPPNSNFILSLNRSPSVLTPSQRLSIHKSSITSTIQQFKNHEHQQQQQQPKPPVVIDDKDELIDDDVIYNVPFSQPMSSLNQREKFLFDNQSRNQSFTTEDSTRTSSIISHNSNNSSVSSVDNDISTSESPSKTKITNKNNNSALALTNEDFNNISKDAQELTVLCNKDEYSQIYDESFQKRKMLSNFKRISTILPTKFINGSKNHAANANGSIDTKYHTFTRPIWLPPKNNYEKMKHQRESENILSNALYKESQLQQKRLTELDQTIKQRQVDIKTWERSLLHLKSFKDISFKEITDLYWRGISPEIRTNVWWKINLLKKPPQFDESFCDFYFDKFLIIQSKIIHFKNHQSSKDNQQEEMQTLINSKVFDIELSQWCKLYDEIYKDLMLNVYPDVNYFQDEEVITKITKVTISTILYLIDQQGGATINPTFDLMKFYFPGMIHLIANFHINFKNTYKSFVSICQFYQLRLPSMMLTFLTGPREMQPLIKTSLNSYMVYKFERILKVKMNRISVHFKIHNVNSFDYLPNLVLSLGLNLFNFEISQRIIDLILFDPNYDEVIINLIVNYMMKIQHKLFGNKEEILDALFGKYVLNNRNRDGATSNTHKYVNVGYEIEFINSLKNLMICK
ncbi:hypothetical protein G210_1567 [Candida maltosa Xu316]|uniref:Oxidant-induced cell-cycle arrest protein 5 n=1 Tax=Candida maltosa (strain Xu316) TaxID=1245528 RepID=M3JYA4_CANMX|nr:hypothetical protein G210_1567 [Candida maltosa Xu316]